MSAVATQGLSDSTGRVKKYSLSFSYDGSVWEQYKENNVVKVR